MNDIEILEKSVIQANPLIRARKEMNVTEMRLFILGLQDIEPHIKDENFHDVDFHETVIPYSQLQNLFGGSWYGNITNLKKQVKNAYNNTIELSYDDGGFGYRHIYRKMDYRPQEGLIIQFDDEMKPYILDILNQSYTKYKVKAFFALSSAYAWRILESLLEKQGYFKKGKKEVYLSLSIEELRFRLNVPDGLYEGKMCNFRSRVLDLPIKEINEKTDYQVWYEPQKTGRKVTGFTFWMKMKKKECVEKLEKEQTETLPEATSPDVAGLSEEQEQLAYRLMNREISKKRAMKLVQKYSYEQVENNLKYCVERRDKYNDLAATIITAIKNDWAGTAKKDKKEAEEKMREKNLDRRQANDFFHGTELLKIGKGKVEEEKEEKKELTELTDIDIEMIKLHGEKAGFFRQRMEKLGLTIEDVKAGKRKK
ncbi:putative replication initiator protein (plasmid) [Selenomonas ruminantium subsp. lactilytica TAM6421]|uniref:Putative replication initiator protein n=1 Tax=Selenomonas ruminantium subsp. lactilytica (strain NBRC 103574 / TAM6421) TaxID=927704 RepID=I0GVL3_SELRL|nr:replication initiation protein [Selenomonas ruminantium]BAL84800.1 putative replication initiator protein [Selenomonas ruminantium subsp. lactilytica TAM6421]